MADPSVFYGDYRFMSPNDEDVGQNSTVSPNWFAEAVLTTTSTPSSYRSTHIPTTTSPGDGVQFSTTALHLLQSLSSVVVATAAASFEAPIGNSSNGTNGDPNGLYPNWETPSNSSTVWEPCDRNNPMFNCTVRQYLEYIQGPQMMPFLKAMVLTTFYVIIFLTGVIGNVIVCIVIVRHSTMHTATNYYLFSLAISDLMFLLMGVPNEVILYWHQYPYMFGLAFCKIRALISEASTYVSVLTIVAFTMERFLAICHPLHLYTMSGFKRAIRIIAALWCVSFLSALPFAFHTRIFYAEHPLSQEKIPESAFCAMLETGEGGFPIWEVSTCFFFIIPMTVIFVLYMRIGMRIRERTRHTQALGVTRCSIHHENKTQSRKAIIRMLAAVVLTFFVCWAPFHTQRLLFLYGKKWKHFQTINEWLFLSGGYLYYISCTINPILYNVMSNRYRIAFKETLCGRRRRSQSIIQSSFHETTIAETAYSSTTVESTRLMRIRSVIPSMRYSRYKEQQQQLPLQLNQHRLSTNSVKWRERGNIKRNGSGGALGSEQKSSVVVILENSINGRTKSYKTSSFRIPPPPSSFSGNNPNLNNNNGSTTSSTTISNGGPELYEFPDKSLGISRGNSTNNNDSHSN